jgi:hypothetical protein
VLDSGYQGIEKDAKTGIWLAKKLLGELHYLPLIRKGMKGLNN